MYSCCSLWCPKHICTSTTQTLSPLAAASSHCVCCGVCSAVQYIETSLQWKNLVNHFNIGETEMLAVKFHDGHHFTIAQVLIHDYSHTESSWKTLTHEFANIFGCDVFQYMYCAADVVSFVHGIWDCSNVRILYVLSIHARNSQLSFQLVFVMTLLIEGSGVWVRIYMYSKYIRTYVFLCSVCYVVILFCLPAIPFLGMAVIQLNPVTTRTRLWLLNCLLVCFFSVDSFTVMFCDFSRLMLYNNDYFLI